MELDDMKNIWNEAGKTTSLQGNKISGMISKPSHGPIARMRRNIRFELITVLILFSASAVYYLIAFNGYSIVSWMYVFLLVLFCLYFSQKNKLLKEMQCTTCHVRSNLELQVKMLEKYVRFYLNWGTAMIPTLMIFFGIVLYFKKPGLIDKTILYPSVNNPVWKFLLSWLILLSVVTIIMYWLNRHYVHGLYGRHIQRLKQLLAQMSE